MFRRNNSNKNVVFMTSSGGFQDLVTSEDCYNDKKEQTSGTRQPPQTWCSKRIWPVLPLLIMQYILQAEEW